MDLKTFLEHLNELVSEGAWRLGAVCWVGNRELRITTALEEYGHVDTPMVSAVSLLCSGVADAHLQLASHPSDCGEFWITKRHPILDTFGRWARLISDEPVDEPERLFAAIANVVQSNYGDLSPVIEMARFDWRNEGAPHFGEIIRGAENIVRQLLPLVREHCPSAELDLQPEETVDALVRPAWLVGFSENWVACDQARVDWANGELGEWLGLTGAPSAKPAVMN